MNSTASSSSPPQQSTTPLQQTTTSPLEQQSSTQELDGNLQTTPAESINIGNNNSLTITSIQESIDITSIPNHTNSNSEPVDGDSLKQQPSSGSLKKVNILKLQPIQLHTNSYFDFLFFFIFFD